MKGNNIEAEEERMMREDILSMQDVTAQKLIDSKWVSMVYELRYAIKLIFERDNIGAHTPPDDPDTRYYATFPIGKSGLHFWDVEVRKNAICQGVNGRFSMEYSAAKETLYKTGTRPQEYNIYDIIIEYPGHVIDLASKSFEISRERAYECKAHSGYIVFTIDDYIEELSCVHPDWLKDVDIEEFRQRLKNGKENTEKIVSGVYRGYDYVIVNDFDKEGHLIPFRYLSDDQIHTLLFAHG